jgi:hypothetical protein
MAGMVFLLRHIRVITETPEIAINTAWLGPDCIQQAGEYRYGWYGWVVLQHPINPTLGERKGKIPTRRKSWEKKKRESGRHQRVEKRETAFWIWVGCNPVAQQL